MVNRIRVNKEKIIGKIDRNIYGHFIEHLGRCIYGGIYEPGSKLSDSQGFRSDVMSAVKRIKVPVLRWPGGNFASNYHWEDGIGPKDKRPIKLDTAWTAEETNQFGTDEFIEYCRQVNAEPYICINLGTGTLDEALHWVEYCNRKGDTYYAKLRERYGHTEPYKVKYWGIGNEIYGKWQHGCCTAQEYANICREYSHFMKLVDPEIKTIAVGVNDNENYPDWDLTVLKLGGKEIDYISFHAYYNPKLDDYYSTVGLPVHTEQRFNLLVATITVGMSYLKRKERIKIAFDEWNIWRGSTPEKGLEEEYHLGDGLFACGIFNVMHRFCSQVAMANLAQLVNVLGAIHTTKDGLILTPIYYAFELYANHTGELSLETYVESDTFSTEYFNLTDVKYLDATTTFTEKNKKLYLHVINRHRDKSILTQVDLGEFLPKSVEIYELNGPDPLAKNELNKPDKVKISKKSGFNISGTKFEYEFPEHSATILEFNL